MPYNTLNSGFQHPQNISSKWNLYALEQVETWLRKTIKSLPFGKPIEVKEIALASRDFTEIEHRGNADGVRYLLWKLHNEGFIDFPDNLHFVVLKNINNNK